MHAPVNVVVFNENHHETTRPEIRVHYPDGIHGTLATGLSRYLDPAALTVRTTTQEAADHPEVLLIADVLVWWGHLRHEDIDDALVERLRERVLGGMGLVVLHSGAGSRLFRALLGTTCALRWRHGDDRQLVWTVKPGHPIADGIQNRRYLPGLTALRDAVAQLGALCLVTTDLFLPHHPPAYVLAQPRPLLQEMAVHLFDAVRAVTGAEPEEVRHADSYRTPWSWFEGDDSLTAHVRMSGALRHTFTGCWSADGRTTSWNGRWQVIGALGTAHWDGEHSPVLTLAGQPARPLEHPPTEAEFPGLAEALDGFLTALHTGTAPQGECHDNLRSLAVVDATLRSAITGRPTPVALEAPRSPNP